MNKIMRNTLAYGLIGFVAFSACASKKNITESTSHPEKETAKKVDRVVKRAPLVTEGDPIDIDKDRSACEEPWGTGEAEGTNRQKFGYMQANYQSKDFTSAHENWKHLIQNAPCGHQNIYLIGEVVLKSLIKKETDSAKKAALINDLNTNFKKRIQYFGGEDKQRERWAKTLYAIAPGEYEIINDNLERSINRDGDSTDSDVMIYYLNNSFKAYGDKKIGPDVMFDKYGKLADIVEHNIEAYEGDSVEFARWSALQNNLDLIIAKVGTCEDLLKQFKPDLEKHKTDKAWLNKAEKALRAKKCTSDPLYINVLEKLYAADPSLRVAKRLSNYYYGAGKSNAKGNEYLLKAISLEPDAAKKSNMYVKLAKKAGSASASKNYADKALSLNSRNGYAILIKGNALYKMARACSGMDKAAAPWIMMDYALKAKAADGRVAGQATRTYNKYSAYKADKETIFMNGLKVGQTYTIKCLGINVTVR